ncbi:MAG: malate dehydrogenase [Dehalococcoidales bacterium]|nr:malate dehydrogenase [Dehalococcoidales bacterium]
MRPKISVIGAGNVGASLAQCLAVKNIANIVLLDIVEGLPQGKALDLQESAPVSGFNSIITGTNNYEDTAKSDVVIVTSGVVRKPGMSRDDLVKINAGIVADVTRNIVKYSPDCVIIIVTNPVDTMTYLALKTSGFPKNRVVGLSGVLDSARLSSFIAMELDVPMTEVNSYALGEHGQNMVIIARFATVNGQPITNLMSQAAIDKLIERTVNGGAEIVGLLKTGSAFYAPAASAARMAEAIIMDKKEILPCAAYLEGEYSLDDVVIGVPVKLGKDGIEEIVSFKLKEEEFEALKKSSDAVRALINTLGKI